MEKRERRRQWFLTTILIAVIVLGHCLTARGMNPERQAMVDSVRAEIKSQGILHPDIVLRQSIWESGWFECTKCSWKYNNPFGFRHRDWVTPDNPEGYKKFDTWQDAVAYYKRWQAKYYKGGDYYEFLTNIGYAEDNTYVSNLKSLNV